HCQHSYTKTSPKNSPHTCKTARLCTCHRAPLEPTFLRKKPKKLATPPTFPTQKPAPCHTWHAKAVHPALPSVVTQHACQPESSQRSRLNTHSKFLKKATQASSQL